MAKDPAFLFYYQDFLVGTEFMTMEECGCYIKILCHMADKGRLTTKHMQSICRAYEFTDILKSKFKRDDKGLFYNERLEHEVLKRRNYTESRRNNAKAYALHMENENEDKDRDINRRDNKSRFTPPEIKEVKHYCQVRKNKIDPEAFIDFYTSKNWMIGSNKMKDWKAAVRTWEKRQKPQLTNAQKKTLASLERLGDD